MKSNWKTKLRDEKMETKRMVAVKSRITDIVNSEYIKEEGMLPSYILTKWGQKISRVNVFGTITDKFLSEDGNYASITIDDGTEAIRAKAFRENADIFDDVQLGDRVVVIGRLREYADEIYINAEIVQKIDDPNYEIMRNLEILKQIIEQKKKIEKIKGVIDQFADVEELKIYAKKNFNLEEDEIEVITRVLRVEEEYEKKDYKPIILETIEKLDNGEGVKLSDILEKTDLPENVVENTIDELLHTGTCYEPSPGIIKKV